MIKIGGVDFISDGVHFFRECDRFRNAGMSGDDRVHAIIATLQLRGERRSKTPGTYNAEI